MSKTVNWPLRIVVILVGVAVAAIFAIALWYGLAYLGMTVIIPIDLVGHAFAWTGVGPAGAWLIIGAFVGSIYGCAKSLASFGRKSDAKQVVALVIVSGLFVWGLSFGATDSLERKAREKAVAEKMRREELERARAREAEERAALDKIWGEGRLWQIASIRNQTTGRIPFQILSADGSWDEYLVKPGTSVTVSIKVRELTIKFDYSYADGNQEKKYTLASTPIIGHEPTKKDYAHAKANSFRRNGNEFDIYQN